MRRRIFSEYGFTAAGHVLSREAFVPFTDRGEGKPRGLVITPGNRAAITARAEKLVGKTYPVLPATDYMMFRRTGDRRVFEDKYFERRTDLLYLAAAEYIEGQGRFTDSVIDLVWMLLEESTWVLPAHNLCEPGDSGALTYAACEEYATEVDYIDLFAACTGSTLAFVWYLLKDVLAAVSHPLERRLYFELQRRIIRPYVNRDNHGKMFWLGIGRAVNNWCPWIISNVLTVCALIEPDMAVREDVVNISLAGLDSFTAMYQEDGGCDEGPSYWGVAAAALFNACEVLYDLTDGYINIYRDPLFVAMGEYITKVYVAGDYFLNFADAPARLGGKNPWGIEWGRAAGSRIMEDFFLWRSQGKQAAAPLGYDTPYRGFHMLAMDPEPAPDLRFPLTGWLPNLCIAVTREYPEAGKGLYLAFKGGSNAEGHNHNDVGSVIVYADGRPLFLDAGKGAYTRRTFSPHRYEIWSMNSDYHNCATFNGVRQTDGGRIRSENHRYDPDTGALTLDLTHACPEAAGVAAYERGAALIDHTITVTDTVTLRADGTAMFSWITDAAPEEMGEGYLILHGRRVTFDPALTPAAEPLPHDEPETIDIPRAWGVDTLWRVTLTDTACPGGRARTYITTVR